MKETGIYIGGMMVVLAILFTAGYFVSSHVQAIEVVEVEPGVKCAVSSRMWNNSIDCWQVR